MNLNKQYTFVKNLERMLAKGYALKDALEMLKLLKMKEVHLVTKKLEEGFLLSQVLRALRFKSFICESISIGEKANKLNEVMGLCVSQFDFYNKLKKQSNKVLLYPVILLVFALGCFEIIRINLYPVIQNLLGDFGVSNNSLLAFIAFNFLKGAGVISGVIIAVFMFFKPLGNLIPLVKYYRTLNLIKHLEVLLVCGMSLDTAFDVLKASFDDKVYRINTLELILIHNLPLPKLAPYTKETVAYFKLGIKSNDLVGVLNDYCFFSDSYLFERFAKITYFIQSGLFILLSVNIFMIYYLIMIPMFQITSHI